MPDKPSVAQRDEADSSSSGRPEAPAYTKGPWEVREDRKIFRPFVVGPIKENGKRDVVALFPLMTDKSVVDANARLIAAAPELLQAARLAREVLEDLVGQLPSDERLADYRLDGAEMADQKLRGAIAKATGTTP